MHQDYTDSSVPRVLSRRSHPALQGQGKQSCNESKSTPRAGCILPMVGPRCPARPSPEHLGKAQLPAAFAPLSAAGQPGTGLL